MNDPVLEFLVGWVMEFGTRPVPGSERRTNKWYKTYINQHHRNAFSNDCKRYFTGSSTNNIPVQITQAGLDYIANGGGGDKDDQRPIA